MKRNQPVQLDTTPLLPFKDQIDAAVSAYDKFIVCIGKPPDEFSFSMASLGLKALKAFETRAEGNKHGIACDKFVTIIFSQQDGGRPPLCGVYFNLHSPYTKAHDQTPVKQTEADPSIKQIPPA